VEVFAIRASVAHAREGFCLGRRSLLVARQLHSCQPTVGDDVVVVEGVRRRRRRRRRRPESPLLLFRAALMKIFNDDRGGDGDGVRGGPRGSVPQVPVAAQGIRKTVFGGGGGGCGSGAGAALHKGGSVGDCRRHTYGAPASASGSKAWCDMRLVASAGGSPGCFFAGTGPRSTFSGLATREARSVGQGRGTLLFRGLASRLVVVVAVSVDVAAAAV